MYKQSQILEQKKFSVDFRKPELALTKYFVPKIQVLVLYRGIVPRFECIVDQYLGEITGVVLLRLKYSTVCDDSVL